MQANDIPVYKFSNLDGKPFEFDVFKLKNLGVGKRRQMNPLSNRPHRTNFYTIMVLSKNCSGQHFIDFEPHNFEGGSLIFLAKEQVHAFTKNQKYKGYLLAFTEQFLDQSILDADLAQHFSLYHSKLYQPVIQPPEDIYKELYQLARNIHREYHDPDDFATEEIMRSTLKILLLKSERIRRSSGQQFAPSRYLTEFQQFQGLLKQHLRHNRQVKFYAEQMQISTKKLNLMCHEIVEDSAKNYINRLITLEAKRLLINTNSSVKEIAYLCGFDDPTNFVKFFKKYTLTTPFEFRKSFSKPTP